MLVEKPTRIRLVEERKHRGWSQRELADYLGTTQHNVSRWETGLTTPGPYFRTKLGELFGMSAWELLVLERKATSPGESDVVTQHVMHMNKHARQAAIIGDWGGIVCDKEGREYQVMLQFKPVGRALQGEGQFQDASQGEGFMIQSITAKGRLVYDRFLTLEYILEEPLGAIQFGFTLLEFMPDGQALCGGFVGYGALVAGGIVTGTVHLRRPGALEIHNEALET